MRYERLLVLFITLVTLGCGVSPDAARMSRDPFPVGTDAAVTDRPAPPPLAPCGVRPMEYEFAVRPNRGGYSGSLREVVITIPSATSPIVAGEIRTFYELNNVWYLYSLPVYFDYRESGASSQVDYLYCLSRAMQPKILRLVVSLPTDSEIPVTMFARFDQVNRSNLVIGGLGGEGQLDPPATCSLDLELFCDGRPCPRQLQPFMNGNLRVCGLRLN
jgi:hypothetical protein